MKKPLKIVGAVLGGILAIGIVAAIAGGGGHSKTAAAAAPQATVPAAAPARTRVITRTVVKTVAAPPVVDAPKPKPRPAPPAAISDKSWTVQAGSLITGADYGGDWKGTARITNENYEAQSASFTFTIMRAGQQIGTMTGSVSQVSPGQTVTVDLISFDSYSPGAFRYYFQTDYSF